MKGFIITEETKDEEGVLGFNILGLFKDKTDVRKAMDILIEEDKLGLIREENAVVNNKTILRFENGNKFVHYEMKECSLVNQ